MGTCEGTGILKMGRVQCVGERGADSGMRIALLGPQSSPGQKEPEKVLE